MEPVYDKCPECRGTKQKMGIGLILKQCPHCVGVGYVPKKDVPIAPKIDSVDYQHTPEQVDDIISTLNNKPRTRGRPPRVQNGLK